MFLFLFIFLHWPTGCFILNVDLDLLVWITNLIILFWPNVHIVHNINEWNQELLFLKKIKNGFKEDFSE